MEEVVRLRGHHLLCLLGFRGLGYSEDFVANMTSVHELIFSGKCVIEIVDGPDDICSACPTLTGGKCSPADRETRGSKKDSAVLSLLSLHFGERLTPDEVYRQVSDRLSLEDIYRLCSRCRWFSLGYCSEGLAQMKDRTSLR